MQTPTTLFQTFLGDRDLGFCAAGPLGFGNRSAEGGPGRVATSNLLAAIRAWLTMATVKQNDITLLVVVAC